MVLTLLKKQNGSSVVSSEIIQRLALDLTALVAKLDERCPKQAEEIDRLREDTNRAFSKIRQTEESLKESVVSIKIQQAKWSIFTSLATAALTGAVVNFFIGK